MDTGVARKPIADFKVYEESLTRFVFRSGFIMKPIFAKAKANPKRIVYCNGEDERVLRATQVVIEEGLAWPILIGRPQIVDARIKQFGLSIKPERDFDLLHPADYMKHYEYVDTLLGIVGRKGVTPTAARVLMRASMTAIGAIAVRRGEADAMLCGLEARFDASAKILRDILGFAPGVHDYSALSLIISQRGAYFMADTHVRPDPSAEEIADMTVLCAEHVRRFGLEPKVALLSHSDFGSSDTPSAIKMRNALQLIHARNPSLQVDGEMAADTALVQVIRDQMLPSSTLKGEANVLVMPNLDAANIAFQLIKVVADALPVGPILIGPGYPAHILTPSVTARGIVNMTAIAVAEAQAVAG